MIMGRPFATLGALLVMMMMLVLVLVLVVVIGPGRRVPLTPLVAVEGTTPPMGTAIAEGRLTIAPQTTTEPTVMALKVMALTLVARRKWRDVMALWGEGEALALPVPALSGPRKRWVLIRVNRADEIAQARL